MARSVPSIVLSADETILAATGGIGPAAVFFGCRHLDLSAVVIITPIVPWSQMNADETVGHIRSPPALKQCSFSTLKPNFTGASILSASAAGTVALNT